MKSFFTFVLLIFICFTNLTFSQFYFFGRNKVQYADFDWKVLKTKHFDIYYYNQTEEIAEIGGTYAEDVFNELTERLNFTVTGRIPLIFYNTHLHFQQTNTTSGFIPEGVGGFFEFIKGRVVIPSNGSLHDFRHVIRHELVHVFTTGKIYHVMLDHRITRDYGPPLWFTEGVAEYMSTEPDDQAEMVMRDAVINNYFVNLEDMNKIYGSFLMYKEGQNFLEFVEEKYGKEKILLMMDNIWMYSNFTQVIEYTLQKPIEEIDNEWTFYLKKKYYPLLSGSTPIVNDANQITDYGFNFSPVYYKIGEKEFLYFAANRDGYASLYRIELNKKNRYDDVDPELVLRGEKSEELESFHLFDAAIDINKNGLLAFVTRSGKTDAIHFFSIKEDEIIKDFQEDDIISISSPKFSSDGNKVVFSAVDEKGFRDIFLLDVENDHLNRLTNDYYNDLDPSFGITDDKIIFSSDRTSGKIKQKQNIFSLDLSTHQINYITYFDCNNHTPIISPDKKYLYYTSDFDKVRNVWRIKIDNGMYEHKAEKITSYLTNIYNPTFSNDSTLNFAGFENYSFNIYQYDLTKANPDSDFTVKIDFDSAYGSWEVKTYFSEKKTQKLKYERQYALDYAAGQVSTAYDPVYGTRGGAILSLSDLLSDDNFFFLIYNTAEVQSDFLKSFNVAIQRADLSKRTNFGYGVFHFSGRRYDIRESDEYFFERSFGGNFLLDFPLSKFHRIEAGVTIANSDKQVIQGVIERKALLLSNSISYVMDNSLWGPTGPLDGTRARLLFGYTGDIKYSNVNYFSVIADLRHYFRLSLRSAFAVRASIFYNQGKEARRYFMGGSWDLRGWPRWSIRGEKLWISSMEFRFPLIDQISIRFPFFGLGFFGIRGAAFFDAGGAWDKQYRSTLGSVGGGFRMNLFGAIVLRYDIGKKIENNFKQFQPGLFYQFFFGWDF